MKSYAEFLRGFVGKRGNLHSPREAWPYYYFLFIIKKPTSDSGDAKLIDVGIDYAEFAVGNRIRIVPLNLLILDVE